MTHHHILHAASVCTSLSSHLFSPLHVRTVIHSRRAALWVMESCRLLCSDKLPLHPLTVTHKSLLTAGDTFIITRSRAHALPSALPVICAPHTVCSVYTDPVWSFSRVWASGTNTQLIWYQDYYSVWLKTQLCLWKQKGVCVQVFCRLTYGHL